MNYLTTEDGKPIKSTNPLDVKDSTIGTLIGEVATSPTANTLLARIKSIEDKLTAGISLSGSNVTVGASTFAMSGGDTLRGKAADKPTAAAAHAVIPYCFYFSIDTGVVEATDGTSWVVI